MITRVSTVQFTAGPDKTRNLETATRLMTEAVRDGAQLVALPECFSHVGSNADVIAQAEDPTSGEAYSAMRAFARENRVLVLAGSIGTRLRASKRHIANRSVLFGPDGRILATYDKIHLFDTKVEGRPYRESDTFKAGAEITTVKTKLGRLGLSICYDLRFPELYRALAFAGARVVFVPAAFLEVTGRSHWLPLLTARAIENQVFIVAPGLAGSWKSRQWHGHSCVIDPWGRVLAMARTRETVVTANLDFGMLEDVRRRLPALKHAKLL